MLNSTFCVVKNYWILLVTSKFCAVKTKFLLRARRVACAFAAPVVAILLRGWQPVRCGDVSHFMGNVMEMVYGIQWNHCNLG